MTQGNMKNSFRATGIFPFNPHAIHEEAFAPSIVTEQPSPNTQMIHTITKDEHKDKHLMAGSSNPQQKERQQHCRCSSISSSDSCSSEDSTLNPEDDSGSDESDDPEATKNTSQNRSFEVLLPTPEKNRKTTRLTKPAINSRGVVLKKTFFEGKNGTESVRNQV